jgi:nucleoid-associated protein YgaU
MGHAQQAVLEFDEEVRAPWRPLLVSGSVVGGTSAATSARGELSRRSPSRVGVCRPSVPPAAKPVVRRNPDLGGRPPAPGARPVPPVRGDRGVASRPRPARLRLTRRARRLAVVLAVCGGVVLGSWLGPLVSGGGEEGLQLAGESSVVVRSGDTLWSIAASVAGEADVRAVVNHIQQLNGLEGAGLVPGQVLQLP